MQTIAQMPEVGEIFINIALGNFTGFPQTDDFQHILRPWAPIGFMIRAKHDFIKVNPRAYK